MRLVARMERQSLFFRGARVLGSTSVLWWRRWAPFALMLIVTCAMLAACGSGKGPSPTPATPAEPSETPVALPTALSGSPRIGPAVWTTAVDPQTAAPIAGGTPAVDATTLYAVFPIESLPAGSQLVASWFFNDTSLDALSSAMRIDRDQVSGWIEFHIQRTGTDPWPDGTYSIVVSDGTTELQRSEVVIS